MSRRWRIVDIWADDDPALMRMRDGLACRCVVSAPDAPTAPETAALPNVEDTETEIAALAGRLRSGDVSVRVRLARLLERLR